MSITFEELAGSPRIRVNEQGTTALRTFRVAWDDWQVFVQSLVGTFRAFGVATHFVPPIEFPGLPSLIVTDVQVEPLDPENPDGSRGVSLGAHTNAYPAGGAKVTATYRTIFDQFKPSRPDMPSVPDGTFLSYSADLGADRVATPGRAWYWPGSSRERVADDINPGLLVANGVFTLRWQRVPAPPWTKIRELRGKINASRFLSSPPSTVLFLGARVSRTFQFLADSGYWNLDYTFSETTKTLRDGTTAVGWNHFYREKTDGEYWAPIYSASGDQPYQSGNFHELFRFE